MTQYRLNSVFFAIIYFATTAMYVYINTYLPVLFFLVLSVNRIQLALIQLISYSALFIKPLFALFSDNYQIGSSRRKPYILFSTVLLVISFIGITFNFALLTVFTIFLAVNFFAASLIDVSVKGMIIDNSYTIESKNRKIFLTKIGASFGSMFPSVIFLIFITDIYDVNAWTFFLGFSFLFTLPLLVIVPFLREPSIEGEDGSNHSEKEITAGSPGMIDTKLFNMSLAGMCIFIFLLYADKMIEYPLEPWIIEKFGESQFYLFSFFIILGIFFNIAGFVLGTFILKKYSRKSLLFVLTLLCGISEILFAFVDFISFLLLMGVVQIMAGIITINLTSIMLDFANLKGNKVVYTQIIVFFFSLSVVIFVPLGTILSHFVPTELIFIISGILLIFSLIPLSQVKLSQLNLKN